MIQFSEITVQRWKNFKKIKRAYYSLIVLILSYVLSLGAELWINDKPLIVSYESQWSFPVFKFYPATDFGGEYKTEADYIKLNKSVAFQEKGWMLFPLFAQGPLRSNLDKETSPPHAPSFKHLLGTDGIARDILSRLVYGYRLCMSFALFLTLISVVLGVIIGFIQGYFGGFLDLFIQRAIEIWSSLPYLYVVILLGSIYGRSFILLIFINTLFSWIGLSYYMRGESLKLKNFNFVRSSKANGMSTSYILFKEILPNALTPVLTLFPFMLIGGISSLTALDFLGFGLQPPTPSWGELIQQGLNSLESPWIALSTISALFITLLLTSFVGEGLRDAFDPKSGKGHDA